MSEPVLIALAIGAVYALLVAGLALFGRTSAARAVAGFVPDCVVFFARLLLDERLARRHKLLVGAALAYLAMPFDLVPDFIPVAGQLDDAVVVVVVLRRLTRAGGEALAREHWPGPPQTLRLLLRDVRPARA